MTRRGPLLLLAMAFAGQSFLHVNPAAGQTPADAPPAAKPPPRQRPPKAPPAAAPSPPMAASKPLADLKPPELVVVCDAKAARYEDAQGFTIWATRSGTITVDNPLRPLTPEATRVLEVIVRDRVATAYGPDLFALRRGTPPAALEATIGGPIRWDAELTVLPDPMTIVSETGDPLAQLTFRECAEAPVPKPAPVAVKKPPPPRKAASAPKPAAEPKAPPGLQVPQGAIAQ